tara:strand:- start:2098 stop:3057 length:960 start_codon:yes stop_codon:yes gene_type:complete
MLEIKKLSKEFLIEKGFFNSSNLTVKAVQEVSFSIKKNQVVGLVGESGSGKSTLGKTIMKLLNPSAGNIIFNNVDITHYKNQQMKKIRQQLQMIFQDPFASLNPRKSIFDTLAEPVMVHSLVSKKNLHEYISNIIHDVGLNVESLSRFPHEFSGGQRQRIGIARALVFKPQFIIADEPVSALDVSIQAQVLNLLEKIRDEYNLTMIFISHDLSVIEYFSDVVIVLYLGRVMEISTKNKLFEKPLHPYSKALLSAVPKVKSKNINKILIKGDIPSPINPPSGCVFRTRCKYAINQCSEVIPELKEVDSDRKVACIRAEVW